MSNIQKYITESGDIYYLSELERFAEMQGVDINFFMQKMEEQGMDMKGFWKPYDIWVSLDK